MKTDDKNDIRVHLFWYFHPRFKFQKVGLQKHTQKKENIISNNIKTNKSKDKENLKNSKKTNNTQELYVTDLPIF